jgi:hypothetical protein
MSNTEENINPVAPNQNPPLGDGGTYFQKRMKLLGVTEANNKVMISRNNGLEEYPVFSPSEKGIDILVYTLGRTLINYVPDGARWKKEYVLTRLEKPIERKDGSIQKYIIPKGQGTFPFFHPSLIEKFEKKETIPTLFLVEGFFKAWKGCDSGIPVVGLSSITHMRDKDSQSLHPDILKLMRTCNVKRMVWLTDGDCLDISSKEITDGKDLYKRPKGFFSSCESFKQLLDDYGDIEKYFVHIDSDSIFRTFKEKKFEHSPAGTGTLTMDMVKGLDDLLITFPEYTEEIKNDILSVSKPGTWFVKHNITWGTGKVHSYFKLSNVNEFYLFHVERRPDIQHKEFIFRGTRYKWDDKEQECKVIVPAAAKLYFRVGDNYYKFIDKVNEEGQIERGFEKRLKTTIVDDHGKRFCEHIPKYEAFCNFPSHVEYHQVIYNNFNVYFPFEHEPEQDVCTEDDVPYTMKFLKHIFGEKDIEIKQKEGPPIKTKYYQLALDYIQLLYQRPTQRLPILCLVSRENKTGKSTFGNLMKAIFTNNATIVGNADLADDFNSFWASKLLIMCDETKIDKQSVVEKVKSLTFAKKIGLNAKGKDKIEIPFFGKFMFFSNNEDNFIYATEEDLRYWVIKVPRLKIEDPDYEAHMLREIPRLLSFLNNRKIAAPRVSRSWFDENLLKTEALKKVIEQSHSTVKKELRHNLRNMFLDFGVSEIYMTLKNIRDNFFRNKEENYIEKVLKEELKMKPVMKYEYKDQKFDNEDLAIAAVMNDPEAGVDNEFEALTKFVIKRSYVMRFTYPRWDVKADSTGAMKRVPVNVSELGRPYKFLRKDFVGEDEVTELPADMEWESAMVLSNGHSYNGNGKLNGHMNGNGHAIETPAVPEEESQGDLPF